MSTNQRSILLQRAIRAERAALIAEAQTSALRAELAGLRAYVDKLRAAETVAAELNPAARHPAPGQLVQLLRVRDAVHDGKAWKCPYTGELFQPTLGTYWRAAPQGDGNADDSRA